MLFVVCPLPIVVFFFAVSETTLTVLESCLPAALIDGLSRLQTHQRTIAMRSALRKLPFISQPCLAESVCPLSVVESAHEGPFVAITIGQVDGLIALYLPPLVGFDGFGWISSSGLDGWLRFIFLLGDGSFGRDVLGWQQGLRGVGGQCAGTAYWSTFYRLLSGEGVVSDGLFGLVFVEGRAVRDVGHRC